MDIQTTKYEKGAAIFRVAASSFVGLVFLVSGYAKAADVYHFASILDTYGISWLGWLAPVAIITEILLGILVLLRINVRPVSILTILFTIGISAIYAYGSIYRGVTDCGCFGHLDYLNRGLTFTLCRNTLLCLLLLIGVLHPHAHGHSGYGYNPREICKTTRVKGAIVSLALIIAAYMCGYTFPSSDVERRLLRNQQEIPYSTHPLSSQLSLSQDSTYLVYVFSFTCPNCKNGIGNIEQYERMGIVDKTIGLALANPEAEESFRELFQPSFEIITRPADSILTITNTIPLTYIIKNDTIRYVSGGNPISAAFFKF